MFWRCSACRYFHFKFKKSGEPPSPARRSRARHPTTRRSISFGRSRAVLMAPVSEPGPSSRHADLRVDATLEFLEAAIHHTLHARHVYPKELFEPRQLYGARTQRCRHPELDAYIGDAISALRRPIATGDVKRVVLAIKDDDQETAAASDGPLERFTFDFLLHSGDNDEGGKPSRDEVDLCSRAFAACLSKIAFADALLAPLPQAAMNQGRLSFEIVAYATRSGVSASMAAGDEWSEERVGAGASYATGDASRDGGAGPAPSVGTMEPRLEFGEGVRKEVVPVKSAVTPIVNVDVFVERRSGGASSEGAPR